MTARRVAVIAAGILACAATAATAQTDEQLERIRNWNPKVGEIQKPGEIQVPKGTIQTPGEIQKPGEIQVPRGIQAVRVVDSERCERRLSVGADALFAFDQWTLGPDAEETLVVLLPELEKAGTHPVSIEGHTDAKGTDAYNDALSEKRAKAVKQWLVARKAVPEGAKVVAYGEKKPIAPNTKPDGSDDPEGRQRNRRVEVVVDTCG
ncbi:OmpA family protein [Candidatus Binatia bacterium]|nr:OmpA family protein [Candidatus Binatia bacterium]